MNSLGATILTSLALLVLLGSARWAVLGMVLGTLYLTQQQSLDVMGFNLTSIRLLGLVAFIRVVARGELRAIRWNRVDSALLMLYAYTTIVFLLRSDRRQAETVGMAVDVLMCYFSFRALLPGLPCLEWFLRAFAVALVPYVALLVLEMYSGSNPFSALGALTRDDLRDGRIRAMGSFRNPSLLGTLGACFLPLYMAQCWVKSLRWRGLFGAGLCLAIVLLSNSGGPVSGAGIAILGWALWSFRHRMSTVRRSLLAMVVGLALVMNAPVWYLLERISGFSGGSGWHRAHLLEMAATDFGNWWLVGMHLEQTRHWFPYVLGITGAADITNAFVEFGLKAGIGAIALFILLLVRAFSLVGQSLRFADGLPDEQRYLLWAMGCALTVHIVTWLGITYFDQIYVIWLMQLAAISSLGTSAPAGVLASSRSPHQTPGGRSWTPRQGRLASPRGRVTAASLATSFDKRIHR